MEDTEEKKKEDLVETETKEETSDDPQKKKLALIIIIFFLISIALVIIAIFVYLGKDFDEELEVFKKYKKIGNITLGENNMIYIVQDKETKLNYTLKEIKFKEDDERDALLNDVKFTMYLNGSNNSIIFYEHFIEDSTVFLITELYIGDLSTYINDSFVYINNILTQLNNILKILWEKNMVHNEIKLENILVTKKNKDEFIIKLGNYYQAKYFGDKNIKINDFEIEPYTENDKEDFKTKDLEDIGNEIYRMKYKEKGSSNKEEMIDKIVNTDDLDETLKDLMRTLIGKNITSWDKYFNHEFFKNQSLPN